MTHSEQTARGEVELKACPFCGKRLEWSAAHESWWHHTLECPVGLQEIDLAIWNRRPSLSPADNGEAQIGPSHDMSAAMEFLESVNDRFKPSLDDVSRLEKLFARHREAALSTTPDAVRGEVDDLEAACDAFMNKIVVDGNGGFEFLEEALLAAFAALHPSPEAPIEGQDVEASSRFSPELIAEATYQVERLSNNLDITNADYVALWLEANKIVRPDDISWLAVRIVEAHEAALRAPIERKGEG